MKKVIMSFLVIGALSGCKYYGSALPPDYPMSMDNALAIARDHNSGSNGLQRDIVRKTVRPEIIRDNYIPESELAVVSPPQTLLVWEYPHIKDDNTRSFGNWETIFLNDRYKWVSPSNERAAESEMFGGSYGTFE